VNSGDTGVVLNYTATDAAGQSVMFDANQSGAVIDGIQFVSSNTSVVDASKFATDNNGNLTFTAGNTGSATITAVNLRTGAVSTTTITVGSSSTVSNFSIGSPTGMLMAGTSVQVPYTATDSFGNAIAQADFGSSDQKQISFVSSNPAVVNASTGITFDSTDNSLNLDPSGAGTATIYVYANGTLQNSITVSVNDAAYPVKVTGVSGFTTYFEQGATEGFSASDFTVTNQYNQAYTPSATDTVSLGFVSGTQGVISLDKSSAAGTGAFTFTGTGTGSSVTTAVYSVQVKDTAGDTTNAYNFTVGYVPSSDIASYAMSAPTTLYDGANSFPGSNAIANYDGSVSLTGKTSSGQDVVLNSTDSTAAYLTSSNPGVAAVVNNTTIEGKSAGTAVITAYDSSGNKLASQTVTVSDTAPAPSSVSFSSSSVSGTGAAAAITAAENALSVTDQYGVAYPASTGYWVSSNPSVLQGGSSLTAGTQKGTTTLTYLSNNGMSATISVTVQ
jgi:hypothetical protein